MRRGIYIYHSIRRSPMVTKLQLSQIAKFRSMGWNQQRIADELGLTQQVVAYQLKKLRERSDDEGIDSVLEEIASPEEESNLLLNELCSWLWEGANILRGPVEHADFKTYLFPLLFYRFSSIKG